MGDGIETQVLTPEAEAQQAEYETAWEEAETAIKAEDAGETKPEAAAGSEEDKEAKAAADADKQKAGEDEAAKKAAAEEEAISKDHGKLESMEKALKDTKATLTQVQQELASIKKETDPEKVKGRLQELKSKADFSEYPELEPLFEALVTENVRLAESVTELKGKDEAKTQEEKARQAAIEKFEKEVKPKIIAGEDGHPDFDEIVNSQEYWAWVDQQKDAFPALYNAAAVSPNPTDIKWAITKYKEANREVLAAKEKAEKGRQAKLNAARSLRGGGTPGLEGAKKGGTDPKDYEGGWDAAGDLLKQEELTG